MVLIIARHKALLHIDCVAASVLCAGQVWHSLPVQWKCSESWRGSTTQEMPTGTLSPWSTLICRYLNSIYDWFDLWKKHFWGLFSYHKEVEACVRVCFFSVAASFSMLVIVSGLWLGTAEPWWPHVPNVWWKNYLLSRPGHRLSHFY